MTCFSYRKILIHASHNHHDADGEWPPRGMFNEPWERGQHGILEGAMG